MTSRVVQRLASLPQRFLGHSHIRHELPPPGYIPVALLWLQSLETMGMG